MRILRIEELRSLKSQTRNLRAAGQAKGPRPRRAIQSTDPNGTFHRLFNLLYADDIILLATSYDQAARLLEGVVDTLASIGVTLALDKCKFIASPDLGDSSRELPSLELVPAPIQAFRAIAAVPSCCISLPSPKP